MSRGGRRRLRSARRVDDNPANPLEVVHAEPVRDATARRRYVFPAAPALVRRSRTWVRGAFVHPGTVLGSRGMAYAEASRIINRLVMENPFRVGSIEPEPLRYLLNLTDEGERQPDQSWKRQEHDPRAYATPSP